MNLIDKNDSAIVMVDVQGKLVNVMHENDELIKNLQRFVRGAQVLEVPIIWLTQYPQGLGPIDSRLTEYVPDNEQIEKLVFSACQSGNFMKKLQSFNCKHIFVAGIEAHICVYQTVVDLLEENYHIEVLADGISSRTALNKQVAIDKMTSLGAKVTSVEMALFEWLKSAEHKSFRDISSIIK